MTDQKRDEEDVTTLWRRSAVAAALIALFLVLLWFFLPRGFLSQFLATATGGVRTSPALSLDPGARWLYAIDVVGPAALRDAGWMLPSLLAVVVGVYVSDYQTRRSLREPGWNGRPSDVRLAYLSNIGVLVAAITVVYLALEILSAVAHPDQRAAMFAVVTVGVMIVVLGVLVGTLHASTEADRLAESRRIVASKAASIRRTRVYLSSRHLVVNVLIVVCWVLWPLGWGAIEWFTTATGSGSGGGWPEWIYWFVRWLLTVQVVMLFVTTGFRLFSRSELWSLPVVLIACVLSVFLVFPFLFVVSNLIDGSAFNRVLAVLLFLLIVVSMGFWIMPSRGTKRMSKWRWTPGYAISSLILHWRRRDLLASLVHRRRMRVGMADDPPSDS